MSTQLRMHYWSMSSLFYGPHCSVSNGAAHGLALMPSSNKRPQAQDASDAIGAAETEMTEQVKEVRLCTGSTLHIYLGQCMFTIVYAW